MFVEVLKKLIKWWESCYSCLPLMPVQKKSLQKKLAFFFAAAVTGLKQYRETIHGRWNLLKQFQLVLLEQHWPKNPKLYILNIKYSKYMWRDWSNIGKPSIAGGIFGNNGIEFVKIERNGEPVIKFKAGRKQPLCYIFSSSSSRFGPQHLSIGFIETTLTQKPTICSVSFF